MHSKDLPTHIKSGQCTRKNTKPTFAKLLLKRGLIVRKIIKIGNNWYVQYCLFHLKVFDSVPFKELFKKSTVNEINVEKL